MQLTYLGHSAFILETKGHRLLIDPFISPNELAQKALEAAPEKAKLLDPEQIEADYVLLTHGHQDHMADAATIAKNNQAPILAIFEIVSWFDEQHGLQGHPLNFGGQVEFPFGQLKFVQAVHSSVLPDGTYAGNPGGFVIWNEEGCIYIAGDTALTQDMKLLPMICPGIDLAVLPIGDNFTMGYRDAVLASDFIACDRVVGCHYDTFPYIEIDKEAARKAFGEKGKELLLPEIGESLQL